MKSFLLFSLATSLFLSFAIGQTYQEYQYQNQYNQQQNYGQYPTNSNNMNTHRQSQQASGNLVMHPVVNSQTGQLMGHMPLPADWKITPQGIFAPNGAAATDYQAQQLPPHIQSIDQVIQNDVYGMLRQGNAQILRTFDLPEVARNDQQLFAQYWKFAPTQDLHQAKGIDIKLPDGKHSLIVVHFLHSRSQFGNMSYYNLNSLTAQPSDYEAAKQTYLYGLANYRHDPQMLAAYNRSEQQKAGVSMQAHNERMRQKQRNFDTYMQGQRELSEMRDRSFESYQNRSNMQDRVHQNQVNSIYDENEMVNPYDNSTINLSTEYDYYYMNQNGEYIGTNDALFNPQTDANYNHMEWRPVKRKRR